jgi:hypothetical protein
MNPRIRPWTSEEDSTVAAMRRDGAWLPAIADALCRTRGAVSKRLEYIALTSEERLQKSQAKSAAVPKRARAVVRERITPSNNKFVPPAVLEERERHLLEPRSLSAILMGDPAPSRSALRKTTGEQNAV